MNSKKAAALYSIGIAALVTITQASHAAPINLIQTEPDIGGEITVGYDYTAAIPGTPAQCFRAGRTNGPTGDCGTGDFTGDESEPAIPGVDGSGLLTIEDLNTSLFYNDTNNTNQFFLGDLTLIANFDESGSFIDGTISATITGGGPIVGITGPTIVTGDLFNFGFSGIGNGGILEFESSITGGDWLGLSTSGITGTIAGITIASGSPGAGVDWDTDTTLFTRDWSGTGSQDTFTTVVPVPAAVWLFVSGLLTLAGVARRRNLI